MLSPSVRWFLTASALGFTAALVAAPARADDGAAAGTATSVAELRQTCRSGHDEPPPDPLAIIARHDKALAACNALIDRHNLAGQALVTTLLDRADLLAPGTGTAYTQALADYARVIALAPKMSVAFWKRGQARLLYMRDLPRALSDLDTAIGLDPSQAEFFVTRASIQASLGEPTKALGDLDRAITLVPHLERAWSLRGLTHFNNGDTNRAIADFDEAIRLAPDADDNYRFRAAAKRAAGREAEAVADEAKAEALSARSPGTPAPVTRP
ncbi:tetratricopeptide repeat protein [Bosea beijingensis]|uniref:tetratricopeptide repeat protein n=1 Tax=Bosea beijingensis TaxID=3068632 RepID=UPI002740A2E9|nr:tetratricopeptide repeat protein [Bosea sp. REN20]